jgi:hypothetical protein
VSAVEGLDAGLVRRLRLYLEHGWADDEILDTLDRQAAQPPTPARFPIGGSPGRTGLPLRERNVVRAALDELREETVARPPRRPGRPQRRTISRDVLVKRFRELSEELGRAPTQQELVDNLDGRPAVRTLQDALTAYGLPWPIE